MLRLPGTIKYPFFRTFSIRQISLADRPSITASNKKPVTDSEYSVIYEGPLRTSIRALKFVSITSSVMAVGVLPLLWATTGPGFGKAVIISAGEETNL